VILRGRLHHGTSHRNCRARGARRSRQTCLTRRRSYVLGHIWEGLPAVRPRPIVMNEAVGGQNPADDHLALRVIALQSHHALPRPSSPGCTDWDRVAPLLCEVGAAFTERAIEVRHGREPTARPLLPAGKTPRSPEHNRVRIWGLVVFRRSVSPRRPVSYLSRGMSSCDVRDRRGRGPTILKVKLPGR
jgi:hypothetical protein